MQKIFSYPHVSRFAMFSIVGVALLAMVLNKEVAHADVLLTHCDDELDIEGEIYIFQNDIAGACRILADNIVLDGNGFSLTGSINGAGANPGDNGFDFTVQNFVNISGDIRSEGDYMGGTGGDIIITNTNFSNVYTNGGDSFRAGSVTLNNASGASVFANGADSTDGNGGNGGDVVLDNSSVYSIDANGSYGYYNNGGDGGNIILTNNSFVEESIGVNGGISYYGVSGDGGNVTIQNSSVGGYIESYGSSDGILSLEDDAPVISLAGDNPLELSFDEEYDEPGVESVLDIKDGDLSAELGIDGTVGEEPGEYIITYIIFDLGTSVLFNGDLVVFNANTTEETRTVIRAAAEVYELSTLSPTNITQTSATLVGQVVEGNFPEGALGFALSDASIEDSGENIALIGPADDFGTINEETGEYTLDLEVYFEEAVFMQLESLECGTEYYYVAIGHTSFGAGDLVYADNEISFTTLPCEEEAQPQPQPQPRRSSGGQASPAMLQKLGITTNTEPNNATQIQALMAQVVELQNLLKKLQGEPNTSEDNNACPADQILTQNMRAGAQDGVFNSYTGSIATEVKILQAHMNRLGFNSGPVDGILGLLTDGAIKRMQEYLGTFQDGMVGPITRSLINASCGSAGLQN